MYGKPDALDRLVQALLALAALFALVFGLFMLADPFGWYQFVDTVTEKLLTYALGRTLEHPDMPVVRQIARQRSPGDLTWSLLISAIVKSPPFLMRRSES